MFKQAIRTNPPFNTFGSPHGKASGPQTHPQKPGGLTDGWDMTTKTTVPSLKLT